MRALFHRDLLLAFRHGGGGGQSLVFFLIAIGLIAFGLGPEEDDLAAAAPGALWVFAMLAALLSLDRVFQADYEDGGLDLLMLGPTPVESVVLSKAAAHWVSTGLPLSLAAPLFGVLLSLPDAAAPWLVATLLVGTPALSLIGAVSAALAVGVRRGGLLISILAAPLYVPTLIFGTMAVRAASVGLDATPALALLGAVTLGCLALAPFAAAAALRINAA